MTLKTGHVEIKPGDTVAELLKSITPEVEKAIADKAVERVADAFSYSLQDQVRTMVDRYVNDHVLPDVEQRLVNDHDTIVIAVVTAIETGCKQLAEKLADEVMRNLDRPGTARKIGELFFGRGPW